MPDTTPSRPGAVGARMADVARGDARSRRCTHREEFASKVEARRRRRWKMGAVAAQRARIARGTPGMAGMRGGEL